MRAIPLNLLDDHTARSWGGKKAVAKRKKNGREEKSPSQFTTPLLAEKEIRRGRGKKGDTHFRSYGHAHKIEARGSNASQGNDEGPTGETQKENFLERASFPSHAWNLKRNRVTSTGSDIPKTDKSWEEKQESENRGSELTTVPTPKKGV